MHLQCRGKESRGEKRKVDYLLKKNAMKLQIGVLAFAVGLVVLLTVRHNSKMKQPTEILTVERSQDGSEGEFNIVMKGYCYYGITQRELDSILISLATDTIK